jgi:hypothetical protein
MEEQPLAKVVDAATDFEKTLDSITARYNTSSSMTTSGSNDFLSKLDQILAADLKSNGDLT